MISPKDSRALAESICNLSGDTDGKRRYGASARERVVKSYNISKRVKELVSIYEDLVKDN